MSRFRQLLNRLFGIATFGALLYCAWLTLAGAWRVFQSLNSTVAVSIVSASAAVIVSTITVVIGKGREARLLIEKDIREKKVPVYDDLIQFMLRVTMGSKSGSAPTEPDVLQFFERFTPKMMVWGADNVVKAWVEFRLFYASDGNEVDPHKGILLYEAVVRAIRSDLGHKNSGLTRQHILGLFLNDAHKLDEKGLPIKGANAT